MTKVALKLWSGTVAALPSLLVCLVSITQAQTPLPASDPQAVALASQAILVLTGGQTISDVTLTGTATWQVGTTENGVSGPATLSALGPGESRLDLSFPNGTRTEIRDAQTGLPLGKWINPDTSSGYFTSQNCWTDPSWFFPAFGSLAGSQNTVLLYIGQEIRNGQSVQRLQTYAFQSGQSPPPTPQQLSTMDFYLDTATLLPAAILYNVHPDNDPLTNLRVEVDFQNYQPMGGVMVPTHIQRYQQGTLMLDLTVTGASFNNGLSLSMFAIN